MSQYFLIKSITGETTRVLRNLAQGGVLLVVKLRLLHIQHRQKYALQTFPAVTKVTRNWQKTQHNHRESERCLQINKYFKIINLLKSVFRKSSISSLK